MAQVTVYHEAYLGHYRIFGRMNDTQARRQGEQIYVFCNGLQIGYAPTLAAAEAQAQKYEAGVQRKVYGYMGALQEG